MPPADLRTRLKELVEEWQNEAAKLLRIAPKQAILRSVEGTVSAHLLRRCAEQLDALLAESEPEADECPFPSPESSGMSGCPCNPIDGKCVYCGAPEISPDCEARAKLPLGHEFVGCYNPKCAENLGCHIHGCGQPRSAHKPK